MKPVSFPEEILRILVRFFMVCFMFARLLSCVGCVAAAFAWAPCRACGWAVAGLCLFSVALWGRLVRCFGAFWADFLVGRLGAFRADLAPSGPIWRFV